MIFYNFTILINNKIINLLKFMIYLIYLKIIFNNFKFYKSKAPLIQVLARTKVHTLNFAYSGH